MNGWYVCIAIVFGSGTVAGCSPVEPDPKPAAIEMVVSEQQEHAVTLDQCLARTDEVELTTCLEQLKAQEDAQLARLEAENVAKREALIERQEEADTAMQRLENRILENEPD
jgi:exonuclease VII large subunit